MNRHTKEAHQGTLTPGTVTDAGKVTDFVTVTDSGRVKDSATETYSGTVTNS